MMWHVFAITSKNLMVFSLKPRSSVVPGNVADKGGPLCFKSFLLVVFLSVKHNLTICVITMRLQMLS